MDIYKEKWILDNKTSVKKVLKNLKKTASEQLKKALHIESYLQKKLSIFNREKTSTKIFIILWSDSEGLSAKNLSEQDKDTLKKAVQLAWFPRYVDTWKNPTIHSFSGEKIEDKIINGIVKDPNMLGKLGRQSDFLIKTLNSLDIKGAEKVMRAMLHQRSCSLETLKDYVKWHKKYNKILQEIKKEKFETKIINRKKKSNTET